VVDRAKQAVTVYDKRKKLLTTFTLPEEYFAMPDSTFGFGDEVRIYAKVPGKAQQLMNISGTDIFKK
jgi:alpha-D-ribose 1-methylphosphonate 5-triphosphate synthase subunit PhnL